MTCMLSIRDQSGFPLMTGYMRPVCKVWCRGKELYHIIQAVEFAKLSGNGQKARKPLPKTPPIAVLDDNAKIGAGTKIRHFSHIPGDIRSFVL